jgi:hypothetical protein
MTPQPSYGSEKAHPFPKNWCVAVYVAGFVEDDQDKE